jgi:hypothetical protein
MVIDDHPAVAVLDVGEAVARRQGLGFAILDVRERVVAGVKGRIAVHADQLIAESDLEAGQSLEGGDEVVSRLGRQTTAQSSPPYNAGGLRGRAAATQSCLDH